MGAASKDGSETLKNSNAENPSETTSSNSESSPTIASPKSSRRLRGSTTSANDENQESSSNTYRPSHTPSYSESQSSFNTLRMSNQEGLLPAGDDIPMDLRMRSKCINEVISTERDYVQDLEFISEFFIAPLKSIVGPNEISKIFSNVETLVGVNRVLLKDFEMAIQNRDEIMSGIAASFNRLSPFLKMYAVYCNNQKLSNDTIDECTKGNRLFRTVLEDKLSDPLSRKLNLQAHLIKPIQRICKYPLLLRELLKYTQEGSPENQILLTAMQNINAVVSDINEKKRGDEETGKLIELQGKFGSECEIVSPGRRIIMEGLVQELEDKKTKRREMRYFLFNDCLIRATDKTLGDGYLLKSQINVDFLLCNIIEDSLLSPFENKFEVLNAREGQKYIVIAESKEDRMKWVEAIKGTVSPVLLQEYKKFQKENEKNAKERIELLAALQEAKKDPKRKYLPPLPPVQEENSKSSPRMSKRASIRNSVALDKKSSRNSIAVGKGKSPPMNRFSLGAPQLSTSNPNLTKSEGPKPSLNPNLSHSHAAGMEQSPPPTLKMEPTPIVNRPLASSNNDSPTPQRPNIIIPSRPPPSVPMKSPPSSLSPNPALNITSPSPATPNPTPPPPNRARPPGSVARLEPAARNSYESNPSPPTSHSPPAATHTNPMHQPNSTPSTSTKQPSPSEPKVNPSREPQRPAATSLPQALEAKKAKTIRFKCRYNGEDTRLIEIPEDELTAEQLYQRIGSKFMLEDASFITQFKDEDGDFITVASDEDLIVAVQEYKVKELFIK
eukprot:TRINITY_DN1886_c0_g1_i1.p1 TRINITY_DN1886_c0_g1~~TRINITY_DN1886_c0_g1_i1.p1  ORF type:complete len:783 (-),score=233.30 TRINITY_DN1886_c0_g1_i1:44-2392(-)